jgi:signal peptidase I
MGRKKEATFQWLKAIGTGVVLAIFLRTFFYSTYAVEGGSMLPTLQQGNLVVVNKFHLTSKSLERGDIVVFHANKQEDYVKRIIGLPGDFIVYKNDVLYVNGKKYDEPYLQQNKPKQSKQLITGNFTLSQITGEKVVPEDNVFVLGDNRLNSYDSRFFGFVAIKQIVGKLDLRYWPINHASIDFEKAREI